MRTIQLLTGVLLAFLGIAAPEIIGALTPGYDPRSDFISELGAPGAPFAALMSYGVFVPVGVLWAIAAVLLWRALPPGAMGAAGSILLLANAISYAGAGIFPCDAGCPGEGTFDQMMHNFSGALGYFLTPPALALIGAHLMAKGRAAIGALTLAVAAMSGLSFLAMASNLEGETAGLLQRLADYPLFVWMLIAAFFLRR